MQVSNWRLTNDMISNEVNHEVVKRQERDGGTDVSNSRAFAIEVLRNGAKVSLSLTPRIARWSAKTTFSFTSAGVTSRTPAA
ncbi:MAG: hypothetical protein R3E66_21100 [bacterium]